MVLVDTVTFRGPIIRGSLAARLLGLLLLLSLLPLLALGALYYYLAGARAFEALPTLSGAIALVGAASAIVVIVVSLVFSRGIIGPLRRTCDAAGEVARGNLAHRVPVGSNDEFGQLALAFNEMAAALQEADRKAKLSEALYRGIFDHAGEAITVSREDVVEGRIRPGAIEAWNPAAEALFGWTAAEMLGQTSERTIPPELRASNTVLQSLKGILESADGVVRYQLQRLRKDGTRIDVITTRNLIRAEDGTLRSIAVFTDITELKRMQEKLIESDRLATLGQFSGNISHELRNPLGVIDGSAFYLKAKLSGGDEKMRQHLERISSSVARANAIIQALLDLTRMKEPRLQPLDLKAVIADAISTSGVTDTVAVVRNFAADEMPVAGDAELLRMAFKNIIRNADEAMDGKGSLTIKLSATAGGGAEATFCDTGPGIPEEDLERVFRSLFTTKLRGVGFGLSITRLVIEKHGGTVHAVSVPGSGAALVVRLPSYTPKAAGS